jgi:epoxyqueuosine reductase
VGGEVLDPRYLARELKRRARAEGFDEIGIAAATELREHGEVLDRWLRAGRHASMEWMARRPELRTDPRRLLPGCRTVLVLGMNHAVERSPDRPGPPTGRIASYALGRDYHKVLGKRARRLADWLERETGLPARSFVDTGPVLERAWAERAGIGWIGKNANLITRGLGSWMLLGVVLSVAEAAPDGGPHAGFCGSCDACLSACPTGAIVEPGVVDSRSCISYWTIERRGAVPADRREGIGEWLFGCDICQEVCPWNRKFARPAPADRFGRRESIERIEPARLVEMDEATFRERFSGTSLMRARWDGIRRNACIVLGNAGEPDALPALERALADPDPLVRSHAAWAVGKIGGPEARWILDRAAVRDDPSPEVVAEIRSARGE